MAEQSGWLALQKGVQLGPLELSALKSRMGDALNDRTYLWRSGMAEWKRAADIPEVAAWMAGDASPAVFTPAPPILAELFSDDPEVSAPGIAKSVKAPTKVDPFEQFGNIDPSQLPPPGEATRFFISQAGVDKRNPPWRIALFVVLLVGVPVLALYLLSELRIVPLEITQVDASGHEVKQSVFSADGVSGLTDLLMGRKHPVPKPPGRAARVNSRSAAANALAGASSASTGSASSTSSTGKLSEADPSMIPSTGAPELKDLYGDARKNDVGPSVRKDTDTKTVDTSQGGLKDEAVAKVVAQTQPAFQFCIEQELRKNPAFRGGKIHLVVTVGGSGSVKSAQIDRADIDKTGLGDCLKTKGKRMVFSAFSGDDTEVEIPLILTASM